MSYFILGMEVSPGSDFHFFKKKASAILVVIWEPASPMDAPLMASLRTQSTPRRSPYDGLMLLSRAPSRSSSREEPPVHFIK